MSPVQMLNSLPLKQNWEKGNFLEKLMEDNLRFVDDICTTTKNTAELQQIFSNK